MHKRTLLAQRSTLELYPPLLPQSGIWPGRYDVTALDAPGQDASASLLAAPLLLRVRAEQFRGSLGMPVIV